MCCSQYARTWSVVATTDNYSNCRLQIADCRLGSKSAIKSAFCNLHSAMRRDLAQLTARTFDVLVVGGGVYGLTIAYDAAQRGLSVALIDRGDFGSGSSFNHLRTLHGGLRYLQTLDIGRARESVRERR